MDEDKDGATLSYADQLETSRLEEDIQCASSKHWYLLLGIETAAVWFKRRSL